MVERSREHIIPKNLFGRVITRDVCIACNAELGTFVDPKLPQDIGVFLAGKEAGFSEGELLHSFEVIGTLSNGDPFTAKVLDGEWQVKPQFSVNNFRISKREGNPDSKYELNAIEFWTKIIQRKNPELEAGEAKKRAEQMFTSLSAMNDEGEIYQSDIGQGLLAGWEHLKGEPQLNRAFWETEWSVAKILFEVSLTLWRPEILKRCITSLKAIREFVLARQAERMIFFRKTLEKQATAQHEIRIRATGALLEFEFTAFGKERWTLEFEGQTQNGPANLALYELHVVNECGKNAGPPLVMENGVRVDCPTDS